MDGFPPPGKFWTSESPTGTTDKRQCLSPVLQSPLLGVRLPSGHKGGLPGRGPRGTQTRKVREAEAGEVSLGQR